MEKEVLKTDYRNEREMKFQERLRSKMEIFGTREPNAEFGMRNSEQGEKEDLRLRVRVRGGGDN